jgi:hypothetical protein
MMWYSNMNHAASCSLRSLLTVPNEGDEGGRLRGLAVTRITQHVRKLIVINRFNESGCPITASNIRMFRSLEEITSDGDFFRAVVDPAQRSGQLNSLQRFEL